MRKLYMICVVAGVFCFSACNKWLTVQPQTQITPGELFTTPQGFEDALYGCYQLMESTYTYNGSMVVNTIEPLACAWETTKGSRDEFLGLHEYSNNDVDNAMGNVFQAMYKVIANVSTLIQEIRNQNGVLDDKQYAQYLGEALGLRAFLHFELMRLWGPVPSLVRETKKYLPFVEQMQIQPYEYLDYRTYMGKVRQDLNEAEDLLKRDVMNIWVPQQMNVNYYLILGLQARHSFWMGENERAIAYGERLLAEDTVKLFPLHVKQEQLEGGEESSEGNLQTLFRNESLWYYIYSSKQTTQLSNYYNSESYVLEELFENSALDDRLNQWDFVKNSGGDGKERKMYLTKYNVIKSLNADKNATVSGYVPLFRISEIYLMMMELVDLDRANELYAEFAVARGCSPVTFATKSDLMQRLVLEYRREFVGEGQLFFAYKRWNLTNMPRCRRGCNEAAYVPPIPKAEFDLGN